MPENTNFPWIKAFVLLFAYTFAIPSLLNLNKFSKCQSRIILVLKPRVLLKLRELTDTVPPPILCSAHQDTLDLQRDISHVLLKSGAPRAFPPTVSMTVSKGMAAAKQGTKPQPAITGIWGRGSLGLHRLSLAKGKVMGAAMLWADPRQYQQLHCYTNTQHWPTCPGSPKVIVPTKNPVPRYPLLAHLQAELRENKLVEVCSNGKYQIIDILHKYFDIKIGISALFLLPW